MSGDASSRSSLDPADPREERVSELVAEYVDRLNRGAEIDPEDVRSEHPDVADDVLEQLELFVGAARPPGRAGPEALLGTIGDYTLRREIGRGGMGVVYEAWEGSLDRRVALKVLPPGIAADDRAFRRFLQEARATGRLSHPNLVAIHAMGQIEQTPFYAMEYVEGETLARVSERLRDSEPDAETPFGPKEQIDYFGRIARSFAEAADGLQHAHAKGVLHRDIKPSNLILDAGSDAGTGSGGRLRILDFGLAHLEGQDSLTASGDVVGTPLYMSPEQARRCRVAIDHRTDIYSLGATLYDVLAGRPPFRGKDPHDTLSQIVDREPTPPRKLRPRVPRDLETIVLKCLRKDPDARYGTAEALAQDLQRFVRGDRIEARPPSGRDRVVAVFRRHRLRLAVAAVALSSLCAIGWLSLDRHRTRLEIRRAACEQAVLGVVRRIQAEKISFAATAGGLDEALSMGDASFSPMRPEELKALFGDGGFGALEEAARELAAAAKGHGASRDAYYHLARAHADLGRPGEARRALDRALACDPSFVPGEVLRLELGGSPLDGEDFERLASACRKRGGWEAWWLDAYASARRKRWSEAASAFGRLLALPDADEPYVGCFLEARLERGVALLKAGAYLEAIDALAAARGQVEGLEADLLLAKAHHLRERPEERRRAAEILRDLYDRARQDNRGTEAALWIAAVYASLSRFGEALEWTERLEDLPVRSRLKAFLLHERGEMELASAAAREALERDARDAVALRVLARALLARSLSEPAGGTWPQALELLRLWNVLETLAAERAPARGGLEAVRAEVRRGAGLYLRRALAGAAKETLARGFGPASVRLVAAGLAGPEPGRAGRFTDVKRVDLGDLFQGKKAFFPRATPDARVLCFTGFNDRRGRGPLDIYVCHRLDEGYPLVRNAAEINTDGTDRPGAFSGDGRELYLSSDGAGGSHDIYVASWDGTRFGEARALESVSGDADDVFPSVTADGLELYFASDRKEGRGGFDIYAARRGAVLDSDGPLAPFRDVENLAELNTSYNESEVAVSADGLAIFWGETTRNFRPEGLGWGDVWMATRPARVDRVTGERVPFRNARNVGRPVNGDVPEGGPCVSGSWPEGGSKLLFHRVVGTPDDWNSWICEAAWVAAESSPP